MLSPKGSSGTCIPEGQTTFLHAACTAHHALHPVQFVAARRPRTCGIGPTDGKVDGDDQLALADHHDKQHTVNTREHPVFLAAPPGAHKA